MPCGIVSGVNLCFVEPHISNPISWPTSTSFTLLRKEFTVLFGKHPKLMLKTGNQPSCSSDNCYVTDSALMYHYCLYFIPELQCY